MYVCMCVFMCVCLYVCMERGPERPSVDRTSLLGACVWPPGALQVPLGRKHTGPPFSICIPKGDDDDDDDDDDDVNELPVRASSSRMDFTKLCSILLIFIQELIIYLVTSSKDINSQNCQLQLPKALTRQTLDCVHSMSCNSTSLI